VISEGTYSVILNIDYLQRSLIPGIKRGLKSGGVVIFENQTTEVLKFAKPLSIPKEYLLNPGELKEAFKEFKTIFYRESNDGKNAVATLVAQKP
jgi:hypothetical protein